MRHALEVLCWLLAATSCAAQGLKVCALAGCNSGMRIELVGMPSTLPAGSYLVEARIEGRLVACSVAVTRDPAAVHACHSSTGAPWVEFSLQASNRHISIHGSAPRDVHLTMFHEGRMVGETRIVPERYEVVEPNGPECGPTCFIAGPYSMLTRMQAEG